MFLKPKKTVGNIKALWYKRYIGLEKSQNLQNVYKTLEDNLIWTFDSTTLEFNVIDPVLLPATTVIIGVASSTSVLKFQDKFFIYHDGEWHETEINNTQTLSNLKFNNVAKYQVNKYYYAGSFDYIVTGNISGTTTQHLKGNIMPLNSMNIKHFNDDVKLEQDDLVVIDGHLYSVENPEYDHKHFPKDYYVYFATLNSIL